MTEIKGIGFSSLDGLPQNTHASKASAEKRKGAIDPLDQIALLAKITTIMANDPNNPLKPQEMQQSFNSAMAAVNSAKQVAISEKLLESNHFSHLLQAGHLVGQNVETKGNQFSVEGIDLQYMIPEDALGTHIEILDESGDVVRSIKADGIPGHHLLPFDKKADDGSILSGGNHTYRMRTFMPNPQGDDSPFEMVSETKPLSTRKNKPELAYIMPKGAAKADVYVIHEKTGSIVQKIPGKTSEGRHNLEIQDFDSLRPDSYKFEVKAFDKNDLPLDVETRVGGIAEGIEAKNGQNFLYRGSIYEPLEKFTGILSNTSRKHQAGE